MKSSSWDEIKERWERKDKEFQGRFLGIPTTERTIRRLVKEGADRARLLRLLSRAVEDSDWWLKGMRRKRRQLESIARQLETVANHAERISLDPLTYGTLWMAILGSGRWDFVKDPKERSPTFVFMFMRLYAKHCRTIAREFGNTLRKLPPVQNRQMIDCLILEIWIQTGQYHDREIAWLLTTAFEAVGKDKQFTEDQIKKHRQRHIVPRIRLCLASHLGSTSAIREQLKAALQTKSF